MQYGYVESPIGDILIAGDKDGLKAIGFPAGKGRLEPQPGWVKDDDYIAEARRQFNEYFAGERKVFDLKLSPHGTAFQLEVLRALQEIPYGETRSYQDIAEHVGRPKAVRAVGAANGRNPLPIVIPCHRVIGSNGSLTGFGGGLPAKRFLLDLEQGSATLFDR